MCAVITCLFDRPDFHQFVDPPTQAKIYHYVNIALRTVEERAQMGGNIIFPQPLNQYYDNELCCMQMPTIFH